jgi:hypothetical protein
VLTRQPQPTPQPAPRIIETCRKLRVSLSEFSKSPLLVLNPKGRVAIEHTQVLLAELEDLADRVTMLEIANASAARS